MDIQMKRIREKYKNSKNNPIDNHSNFTLWKDYDNVRIKLQEHNEALKELTQKVLKLNLFNPQKITHKNISSSLRYDKLKNFHKKSYQKNDKEEIFIIKKLLLINLKSFQVMQRLYQENYDLQKLVDKTNQFATRRKEEIQKIKQENEVLHKATTFFKTGLCLFFNKFDNVTDKIILQTYSRSGFQNLIPNYCNINSILQQKCKPYEISTKEVKMKMNSTKESNYTSNVLNLTSYCKPLSYNFSLQLASERSIFYDIPIQLYHLHHTCTDLARQKLNLENTSSIEQSIENKIYNTQEVSPEEKLICDLSAFQATNNQNDFSVFEDAKSLLLLKNSNFLSSNFSESIEITNPLVFYKNIKSYFELYRFFDSYNNEKEDVIYIPRNIATNEIIEFVPDKKTNFQSGNSTQKTSGEHYSKLKISQSLSIYAHISTGVGDSSALFFDKQSQVDYNSLTEIISIDIKNDAREDIVKITSKPRKGREKIIKKTKSSIEATKTVNNTTDSRQEFEKSLQDLREVIEFCKRTSEQSSTSKKFHKTKIKESKQHLVKQPDEAMAKKGRKPFFWNNKKEYKKVSKIPEMDKTYQIALQNIPQGISLKFMKLNNSNVQKLITDTSYSTNSSLKRLSNFSLNK